MASVTPQVVLVLLGASLGDLLALRRRSGVFKDVENAAVSDLKQWDPVFNVFLAMEHRDSLALALVVLQLKPVVQT
jgi:hypothetical protein